MRSSVVTGQLNRDVLLNSLIFPRNKKCLKPAGAALWPGKWLPDVHSSVPSLLVRYNPAVSSSNCSLLLLGTGPQQKVRLIPQYTPSWLTFRELQMDVLTWIHQHLSQYRACSYEKEQAQTKFQWGSKTCWIFAFSISKSDSVTRNPLNSNWKFQLRNSTGQNTERKMML